MDEKRLTEIKNRLDEIKKLLDQPDADLDALEAKHATEVTT